MATTSKRPKLILNPEQQYALEQTAQSRRRPQREVQRAQILLRYASGQTITTISHALRVSRVAVYKWIDRALAVGTETALSDKHHRPKEPIITEEAKAWVVSLACTKPKDHGYAAEVWSHRQLAKHVRENALTHGFPSLRHAAKATIQRILKNQTLQPHKVKYYMERRDPQFDEKMREVLLVYQEVNVQNQAARDTKEAPATVTVSVDEKPGVQAIANTAPDLPPKPGEHPQLGRDYEYKRYATLSILAGLDLHDGHVTAEVHPRHRSREFILLLKALDAHYPPGCVIRLVLDNHSAHISKETMAWLATKPNRFVYVHTPKHGSWLNLVETLFGKMARTFLKHIRVASRQELKDRILLGIAEINQEPVVHRWKKFDALNT
ncbi:MAG: IS630 family transposase [Candidatus Binatia bacterium]